MNYCYSQGSFQVRKEAHEFKLVVAREPHTAEKRQRNVLASAAREVRYDRLWHFTTGSCDAPLPLH